MSARTSRWDTPERLAAHREAQLRYRKAHPKREAELRRCSRLKARYGITGKEYAAMYKAQHGRCIVCGTPEAATTGKGRLHVDHNHSTGAVRGLACHSCNVGLGNFHDNPILLREAAAYLELHETADREIRH